MTDINMRFAQIRRAKELNKKQFADSLGINQSVAGDIELGKREPSRDVLIRLATVHKVNINWLLTGDGEPARPANSIGVGDALAAVKNTDDALIMNAIPEKNSLVSLSNFSLFKFSYGKPVPVPTQETDPNAMVLIPVFSQRAAAGPGQPPNQLAEIEAYVPIFLEMLGGIHPRNCGVVRVVGDSMTDMTLFNGDLVIFDRSQNEGDGVYVISIGTDVRVKRVEYRPFEKKIIISSENVKRYPDPEVISYEQAEAMLMIHGKVICWMHRHPY